MPRIKKVIVADKAEIEPIIPQQGEPIVTIPVVMNDSKDSIEKDKKSEQATKDINPDIQAPLAINPKKEFKQLHTKDIIWLENDLFQTLADLTGGKKGAKALIINQALKDYLRKNKMKIKPLKVKSKKD